jgi:hypothetical protein
MNTKTIRLPPFWSTVILILVLFSLVIFSILLYLLDRSNGDRRRLEEISYSAEATLDLAFLLLSTVPTCYEDDGCDDYNQCTMDVACNGTIYLESGSETTIVTCENEPVQNGNTCTDDCYLYQTTTCQEGTCVGTCRGDCNDDTFNLTTVRDVVFTTQVENLIENGGVYYSKMCFGDIVVFILVDAALTQGAPPPAPTPDAPIGPTPTSPTVATDLGELSNACDLLEYAKFDGTIEGIGDYLQTSLGIQGFPLGGLGTQTCLGFVSSDDPFQYCYYAEMYCYYGLPACVYTFACSIEYLNS